MPKKERHMKRKTRNIIIGAVAAGIVLSALIIGICVNNVHKKDMKDVQLGQLDKVDKEPEILQATSSAFTIADYPYNIKFTMIDGDSNGIIALDSSGYIWEWSNGNAPSKVSTGVTKFKYIAKSSDVNVAIDTSGNIWTWGQGSYGILGNGVKTNNKQTVNTPTKITSGTNFTKVAIKSNSHAVALDSSGNIWGWGQNKTGQLLNEAKGDYYQQISWTITKPTKLTSGKQYIDIRAFTNCTIALDSSKKLYIVGECGGGSLLDYTYKDIIYEEDGSVSSAKHFGTNTFVQIANDMTYTQIAGSSNYIYLIGTDNSVYKWGDGNDRTKPSLTKVHTYSSPITYLSAIGKEYVVSTEDNRTAKQQIILELIPVQNGNIKLEAYFDHNGDLWMRGYNDTGIICDGTTEHKSDYVRITGTSCTVTLNTNGGTINSGNVTSYMPGTEKALPTNVTKSGYTFAGWYANSSLTGDVITKIASTETGNKTYYAKWEISAANTYTVAYNANGGSGSMSNSTHTRGVDSKLRKNTFTKTGYSFLGWTFEAFKDTFSSAQFIDEANVTERQLFEQGEEIDIIELYAVWWPNTYTVKYNANGGSGSMSDTEHAYGGENTTGVLKLRKNTFTRTGYKFKGWSKNSTATTASYSDEEVIKGLTAENGGTVVLYAVWEANTYTVTFKDGANVVKTQTVNYGTSATAPTLTKEGYTLSWDKSFNNVKSDLEVNAVWTINTHTVTFKDGTNIVKTQTVNHGTSATAPTLTKEGYTLSWDKSFNNVKSDLEVNAVWTINTHTVTFKDGTNIVKTQTVNYGTSATAPTLTKQWYVLRWDKEFNNVKSDLEVNAIWLKDTDGDGIPDIEDPETLVNYKVEHYKQNLAKNGYDTPEIETKQGNLGTTVTAETKQYQGFNLVTKPETIASGTVVDDGSLTLKLYYDRNTYTITLNPNGGTINEPNYITEYTYGIGGVLPTDVTKPGYTFGGWYDNAQLTGNVVTQITNTDIENKTYYASWIAKGNTPYKVLHYKQAENGYVLEETDNLTAQTDTIATAIPKNYEGYAENVNIPERIPSGTVVADGSLELKLYYDKINYTVIFKDGDNILDTQTISYGEAATAPTPTKQGYVLRWDKEFNNVKSDLEVNAIWLRDTDGDGIPDIEDPETLVEYVVKHYKQQGNTNTYELADTETKQGNLGTIVTALPKQYEGYIENTNVAERIPSGTITSDEKLELRLFYNTMTYTVIFKDGDNILDTQTINHGEAATAPTPIKEGYILTWDKDFSKIISDLEINAVWTKIPEKQRAYKVEHYIETKEGGYILKETDNIIGNIGDIATAKAKVYEEYILDESNKDTVKTGKIEEDKELVLKLYYKYKRFQIIFKDGDKEVGREEVIYGGTAKPPVLTKPGYILSWDKDINNITKDQTFSAVWTKDPNYKNPNEGKEEQKPSILPKTGEETVTLGAIMGLLGIAIVYFVKYKF